MCNESIPSDVSTLVNDELDDKLNLISPFFKVDETQYGGRGCFSYGTIPKGTMIATCRGPISSTILKEYKKEVCNQCFSYLEGNTLKYKLANAKCTSALYFCTQKCLDEFKAQDVDGIYLKSLLNIEDLYQRGLKKPEIELSEPNRDEDLNAIINFEWQQVNDWEVKVNRMKQSKKENLIPRISDSEYVDIKYIIGVLFQLYKYSSNEPKSSNKEEFLSNVDADTYMKFELETFEILQANENDKVFNYPYLLQSHINIYKFIKLSSSPLFQPFISTDSVRKILGRHIGNAFGIWSVVTDEQREDKDFFGYSVYPTASFFNHSCAPNIIKKRDKNQIHFTTLRDIEPNEELCINYGYSTEESVEVRRKDLKEWFFDCSCPRCIEELKFV